MTVVTHRPGATTFASIALLVFVLISVWMIDTYMEGERSRDLQRWQDRLSVIAETKKRAIENWLQEQTAYLQELADNPLLQIYLSLDKGETGSSEVLKGQVSHLRNLVAATARRAGVFTRPETVVASQQAGNADGIAIFDSDLAMRMSTRGFPPDNLRVSEAITEAMTRNRVTVYGIYADVDNMARLVIVIPVRAVQSAAGSESRGAVVALINPENSLYKVVEEQWLTTTSDESLLVMGDEFSTSYISPLQQEYSLFYQVPISNRDNAANFARAQVGDFAVRQSYTGEEVLVTSRNINRTRWVLVQTIHTSEALRESAAHREFIYTVFLLVVFILTITFIAVWRHASSLQLKKMAQRLSERTDLLNTVTDNIKDKLFLLDQHNHLVFINRALAEAAEADSNSVRGKELSHLFSKETAASLQAMISSGQGQTVCELEMAGEPRTYHVATAELSSGQYRTSWLVVLHDITDLQQAQVRHEQLLEGVITTLVRLTDQHDPHCAHHSERTRDVCMAIADAMQLEATAKDALAMAAMLANIGKLNLPRELLTKMEPLTPEEASMMHDSNRHTVNILQSLVFDGPVVDIIAQKNEYLDGSGYPFGLGGDDILPTARILAVANAFVAMTSSRAYREGRPMHDVFDILYSETESRYDRAVVAALMHVAESRPDWSDWHSVTE